MKLVIDISDREYKQRTEFPIFYGSTIDKAIANGTPLSKELEKIKAEIDRLYSDCLYGEQLVSKPETMQIIDNHIKEQKGEK